MINNPQNFFDQVRNLCEELGLKMKAISESIAGFISKSEVEQDYLKKDEANVSFLSKNAKAASASYADSAARATSADTATKAVQDADGATIATTYLKVAAAQSLYLGKTAKAESAKAADSATAAQSATKATQDGSGNNIEATYAKKSEIPSVPEVDISGLIPKTGDRGLLSGYEQVAYAQEVFGADGATVEVNENLPDSIMAAHSYNFRLSSPEEFGRTWTKVIVCGTAPSSVWMSGYWTWANEEVPTLEGQGYLVCHWAGVMGVASYVHTYEFIDPEWPV